MIKILAVSILSVLVVLSSSGAYALSEPDTFVTLVNLERIRAQILLVDKSLEAGNTDSAFAHAFIPHSVTFPAIKKQLSELDSKSSDNLESSLTDLAFGIKDGSLSASQARSETTRILGQLDSFTGLMGPVATEKSVTSQVTGVLLQDALQSYQLSNNGLQQIDYENAVGLVGLAKTKYLAFAESMDERRRLEVNSFFADLEESISEKSTPESVARLIGAIERDFSEDLSINTATGGYAQYFATIRTLLSEVVQDVQAGNYKQADQKAVAAYLDNYEFLEAPIEKHDSVLVETIEIQMREELRQLIKSNESPQKIESFVTDILAKLDTAESLLRSDSGYTGAPTTGKLADIEGLSQGFGAYQGERKDRGEADDPAKAEVRANIDQIRLKLDETLRLYKGGNKEGALLTVRSAYLDSYENIELPLRPIDPDFTLDMEIKFAELRNLMQSNASYESVLSKVVEIRKGLDESERLVSGSGIVAPTIAFSTSFSIVFREGLESALIIGAILTYLEASRNERFKKHVYYGIVLAFAGTAATWFVAQYVIDLSGANRELIEAIAGISAVAVLFWVSFWILNKVETKKWIEFVKAKVWKATATGSVMVFVMLSFFTVYREGFETVLFYQAMLSFAKYMEWYVAAGLVSGLAVIVGITFLVRKLGKKLPLRVLFGLTMGIGAYMSIAFIGNAVREFQEVGYLQTTHLIGTVPRLDINIAAMTGIHPTLETIVAQIALLGVYLFGSMYVLVIQPRRKKMIDSARKSRADLEKPGADKKADIDVEDH